MVYKYDKTKHYDQINVKIPKDEKVLFKMMTERKGTTISDVIRKHIKEYIGIVE